jgi:hypothetical protein
MPRIIQHRLSDSVQNNDAPTLYTKDLIESMFAGLDARLPIRLADVAVIDRVFNEWYAASDTLKRTEYTTQYTQAPAENRWVESANKPSPHPTLQINVRAYVNLVETAYNTALRLSARNGSTVMSVSLCPNSPGGVSVLSRHSIPIFSLEGTSEGTVEVLKSEERYHIYQGFTESGLVELTRAIELSDTPLATLKMLYKHHMAAFNFYHTNCLDGTLLEHEEELKNEEYWLSTVSLNCINHRHIGMQVTTVRPSDQFTVTTGLHGTGINTAVFEAGTTSMTQSMKHAASGLDHTRYIDACNF